MALSCTVGTVARILMSTMEQFRARFLVLALLALAMFAGISAVRMTYRHFRIERDVGRIEAEIIRLQEEREEAERALVALDDLTAIERVARETLNLKREGEQVVVVVPSGVPEAPPEGEAVISEPEQEPSNPVKWWAYFFGQ